ncbi:MAG: family 78 glycoside hydrolase catalytic domain [Clostridia bacterium]|nr:family 78 glycoside hydrolase catalytic domain [Clostridia bacterium]
MFNNFIKATDEYTDFDKNIPGYYFRKTFETNFDAEKAELSICTPGFYLLYINGVEITKGHLAPYISNPDHFVCYDEYDVTPYLKNGKNAIGFILGNGFANQTIKAWEFSDAPFRAPLCASLKLNASDGNKNFVLESSDEFKCHPSPIIYDMYRYGTHYDARLEIDGWCDASFDDTLWENAMIAPAPKGEQTECIAEPISTQYEIAPKSIEHQKDFCYLKTAFRNGEDIPFTHVDEGYVYDFGKTVAGVCRLKIKGEKGQKITIRHGERLTDDGKFNLNSVYTFKDDYKDYIHLFQADVYILKGGEEEIFLPPFTYHGFRYALVEGVSQEQATSDLLTAVVFNSDIKQRARFRCSDSTVNTLYDMTILADNSNFHYFPTDCPQREKNGWTGDAAASAEQYSMFFECEKSFEQWLMSIRYSQRDGMIPGIVPTSTWGYAWGNGPAWDAACIHIPYYSYKYNGNKEFLRDNSKLIYDYLKYISGRRNEKGLIAFGLGDWCQPGSRNVNIAAPLELTDTAMTYDSARKAAFIFEVLGKEEERAFAQNLADELRRDIRLHLIDYSTMSAAGSCQTSQAFLLSLGIFEEDEYERAYQRLLDFIAEKDNFVICGVIGLRHIFEVLCLGGNSDIALEIMCRDEEPSFGAMIKRGATALCEALDENGCQESSNHHFYGDIIRVFACDIAGLKINPDMKDINSFVVSPVFPDKISNAEAEYDFACGTVRASWKKEGNCKLVEIDVPQGVNGRFEYGTIKEGLKPGLNTFKL